MVNSADEWEENGLSGGGLDNCGFAYSGGVEVDIGALFDGFSFDI